MIVAKTASRNVAFKSVFSSQVDILTRQLVTEDSSNESEANFQDLDYNADLYIFNQDDRQD